jgi:hypothetical protein
MRGHGDLSGDFVSSVDENKLEWEVFYPNEGANGGRNEIEYFPTARR